MRIKHHVSYYYLFPGTDHAVSGSDVLSWIKQEEQSGVECQEHPQEGELSADPCTGE